MGRFCISGRKGGGNVALGHRRICEAGSEVAGDCCEGCRGTAWLGEQGRKCAACSDVDRGVGSRGGGVFEGIGDTRVFDDRPGTG